MESQVLFSLHQPSHCTLREAWACTVLWAASARLVYLTLMWCGFVVVFCFFFFSSGVTLGFVVVVVLFLF